MEKPVLVRLFLDQYGAVQVPSGEALLVTDVASYAGARRAIEELKAGARPAPLTIVVHTPRFFSGFHDMALLGDLAEIRRIAPREDIEALLHMQLPAELTDQDLISLGIQDHSHLLPANGSMMPDEESLDDALLAKALGSKVFARKAADDFGAWCVELLAFLHHKDTPNQPGWGVHYVQHLLEERVRIALARHEKTALLPFILDLLHRASHGESQALLNQLAVRYWLRSYTRLARKEVINNLTDLVGPWYDSGAEAAVLDTVGPWAERLYRRGGELAERLEHTLELSLQDGDLIETDSIAQFLDQTSGYFAAEYEAAQARLASLLWEGSQDAASSRDAFAAQAAHLEKRFKPLLTTVPAGATESMWVVSLAEFTDMIAHLKEISPAGWADWLPTYELLLKARRLRADLVQAVPSRYRPQCAQLFASLAALDERLNAAFGDWLLAQYPKLLAGEGEPYTVIHAVRMALERISRRGKVIILVLDGVDWELWRHLRSALAREGFIVHGSDASLAVLPTITEFSRRAILGALAPRDLARFVDDVYGTDIPPREEARTLARALGYLGRLDELKALPDNKRVLLLGKELAFASGGVKDIRRALSLDARCYALVYGEVDAHIHVSKLEETQLRQATKQWLADLAGEIVQGVRSNRVLRSEHNLFIVVTSDHGFIHVPDGRQADPPTPPGVRLDVERHGRLALLASDGQEEAAAAQEHLRKSSAGQDAMWHIIWRDQAEQYGLVQTSRSEGHIVAFLMPRLFQYVRKGKANYVHGGLSMYETIVPSAVLSRGELQLQTPTVTLSGQLASEEQCELSVAILNTNERALEDLVVGIPEIDLQDLRVGDLLAGDVAKLTVLATMPKSGDIPIHIELRCEAEGSPQRFRLARVVQVQPGRRERMRSSTRRISFDEDEW